MRVLQRLFIVVTLSDTCRSSMVPPAGFEPALPPPEGGALSPELRGPCQTTLAHRPRRTPGHPRPHGHGSGVRRREELEDAARPRGAIAGALRHERICGWKVAPHRGRDVGLD